VAQLRKMRQSEELVDVTLKIGPEEKIFRAHRLILAFRSDVFKRMFFGNMKERWAEEVCIPNVSSETFEDFLDYVYTGSLHLTANNSLEMMEFATQYDILEVKEACQSFIRDHIRAESVCPLYITAMTYDAQILQKECLKYIFEHAEMLLSTDKHLCFAPDGDILRDLLSKSELEAQELTIWKAVVRWIEYHYPKVILNGEVPKEVEKIIETIRFPLVSSSFFC
jgi:hypothetical protein